MVFEYIFIFLASLAIVVPVCLVYGILLMPLRARGCSASLVVRVGRELRDAERLLRGAEWLAARAGVNVVIVDCGLTDEGHREITRFIQGKRFTLVREGEPEARL